MPGFLWGRVLGLRDDGIGLQIERDFGIGNNNPLIPRGIAGLKVYRDRDFVFNLGGKSGFVRNLGGKSGYESLTGAGSQRFFNGKTGF